MKYLGSIFKLVAIITSVGGLISITLDFPDFMEKKIYRSDLWTGNFSTNFEYSIITGDFPETPEGQGKMIMRLGSKSGSGSISGDIISEGLCEYNPITWQFFLDSSTPSLSAFGKSRNFKLSYLREGKKELIATLRLEIQENEDAPDAIIGTKLSSAPGLNFPERIVAARDLAAFDQDLKELDEFCGSVTKKFHEAMLKKAQEEKRHLDAGPTK